MTARVLRAGPKPGSRQWRHQAVCSDCAWHGYRYTSEDSAIVQAERHNAEKHPPERTMFALDPGGTGAVLAVDIYGDNSMIIRKGVIA